MIEVQRDADDISVLISGKEVEILDAGPVVSHGLVA